LWPHVGIKGICDILVGRYGIACRTFFFIGLTTIHTDVYTKMMDSFVAYGAFEGFMDTIKVCED